MLDPRLYRAALLPLFLALVVCAFSLENRPAPIGSTLPPDAFDAPGAMAVLEDLGDRFADRRPGSAGDEALAGEVAGRLRGLKFAVRAERFEADTIDGRRELVNVIARRAGAPGPGLVVVAHRDAAGRGARAELSGTAALLELARIASEAQLERTITFVSTSGGSGGAGGARALVEQLGDDPVDAVLVLGDLAGERIRKPLVVPWGDGRGRAPLGLERTVEAALRTEAATRPGGSRASAQLTRLALPGTVGEQGPLVSAGRPAVLLSASGERPPRPGERVVERHMEVFGRAALRSVLALDAGPVVARGPVRDVVTLRKVLPGWALRLLVAALLLPVLVVAIDALARANRRGERVAEALVWLARAALPLLAVLVVARLLGLVGLLPFPPSPMAAPGLRYGGRELAGIALLVLVAVLVLLLARPRGRFAGPGAAAALAAVLALVAAVTWVRSPAAALLLALPAHLWLLLAAPRVPLRRVTALALVAVGVAPLALAIGVRAGQLGVPLEEVPLLWLGIAAGGHLGVLSWLTWSLLTACLAAALAAAWRARSAPPQAAPAQAARVVSAPGWRPPASALRR